MAQGPIIAAVQRRPLRSSATERAPVAGTALPLIGEESTLTLTDLGVVVLAYGRSNRHAELLYDLGSAGVPSENIIVSYNPDSPDSSWRPLVPDGGKLLVHSRNAGYSAAMNRGIRALKPSCSAALLLTHDVRLAPTALVTLLAAADVAPDFGLLGFTLSGASGNEAVSYGGSVRRDGTPVHTFMRPAGGLVAETEWVDGCAVLLRAGAAPADPLPERYFLYFEDLEMASVVRARGFKVGIALDAIATSASGVSARRAAFEYLYVRNGLDWTRRRRGKRAALRYVVREARYSLYFARKSWHAAFRQEHERDEAILRLAARAVGVLDALWGRWGPPPAWLLHTSDIRNV